MENVDCVNSGQADGAVCDARRTPAAALDGCDPGRGILRARCGSVPVPAVACGLRGFLTIWDVIDVASEAFRISPHVLCSGDRSKFLARARQAAMVVARETTGCSYPEIGMAFGRRDHTTVIAAERSLRIRLRRGDAQAAAMLEHLRAALRASNRGMPMPQGM